MLTIIVHTLMRAMTLDTTDAVPKTGRVSRGVRGVEISLVGYHAKFGLHHTPSDGGHHHTLAGILD